MNEPYYEELQELSEFCKISKACDVLYNAWKIEFVHSNVDYCFIIKFPPNYPKMSPIVEIVRPDISHWPFQDKKWIPLRWKSNTKIKDRLLEIIESENILLPVYSLFSNYITTNCKKDISFISFGCSNDINQQYPPYIQHELSKYSNNSSSFYVDIILIDPFLTEKEGSFKQLNYTQNNVHYNVYLITRVFSSKDIEELEKYVKNVINHGKVYIGDFAVGSYEASISSYIKRNANPIWSSDKIIWLKPLERIGEPYDDGYQPIEDSIRQKLQKDIQYVDHYKGEMFLDDFIIEDNSFLLYTKFRNKDVII